MISAGGRKSIASSMQSIPKRLLSGGLRQVRKPVADLALSRARAVGSRASSKRQPFAVKAKVTHPQEGPPRGHLTSVTLPPGPVQVTGWPSDCDPGWDVSTQYQITSTRVQPCESGQAQAPTAICARGPTAILPVISLLLLAGTPRQSGDCEGPEVELRDRSTAICTAPLSARLRRTAKSLRYRDVLWGYRYARQQFVSLAPVLRTGGE